MFLVLSGKMGAGKDTVFSELKRKFPNKKFVRLAYGDYLKEICINVSKCVGEGLYGIDVKETKAGYKVIEINDNPSIYRGYEDTEDKDIYEKIINAMVS